MGYVREFCNECQKEHLMKTVCDKKQASNSSLIDGLNALIDAWQVKEKTMLNIANSKGYEFTRGRAVQLNECAESISNLIKGI